MSDLLLLGASGLAREALTIVRAAGEHEVVGFLDDDPSTWGRQFDGITVRGGINDVDGFPSTKLLLCPGRGAARTALAKRLSALGRGDDEYVTIIDESVVVPPSCRVGSGSILLAGSVLTTNIEIGRHVVVMPNVTLTHDDFIESFVTLCAGVSIGGNVVIGASAYLGMNASVREGVRVGKNAVLGMGAVLLADLPPGEVWAGIPARQLMAAAS
jgi:sugar O-acyltransferase (sialic acid O-acetyltransferase NeuD family)